MKTEYLLEREVDLVLAALTSGNALVVRAMLETGLRVGDVLALQLGQIRTQFWLTEQKTGKRRHVGLTQQLVDDIKAAARRAVPSHVLARYDAGADLTLWAFPSPKDWRRHRTRQAVWADIKRAARAFRLPVNAGTHSLRKVYAVELREKYGDIPKVRRALGHSSDAVTMVYAIADQLREDKLHRRTKRRGRTVRR